MHVQVDNDLRKAVRRDARPRRMHAEELRPNPLSYYDVGTGQRNRALGPGNIVRLYGDVWPSNTLLVSASSFPCWFHPPLAD